MANEFMDIGVANSLKDRIILIEKEISITKVKAAKLYLKLVMLTDKTSKEYIEMLVEYNDHIQNLDKQQAELNKAKYLLS